MNTQSENLTTKEQKMAFIMGYDVEGPSLVERIVSFWHVFKAYRYIHANNVPMQVILRNVAEAEQKQA
jgi:hypothetical protein